VTSRSVRGKKPRKSQSLP